MRVYVDSRALLKRVIDEPESEALLRALEEVVADGSDLVSSALARIEVSRALGILVDRGLVTPRAGREVTSVALSGVRAYAIGEDVVGLARRVGPPALRTLDAIHLATAILLDADRVVAYDNRVADACNRHGLEVMAPA